MNVDRLVARYQAWRKHFVEKHPVYEVLASRPWAAVIGLLAFVSGIIGVFQSLGYQVGNAPDALAALIGRWQILFQVAYLFGGLLFLIGIGTRVRTIEAPGIVLLGMSVLVRLVVLVYYLGFALTVVISTVFYMAILWACVVDLGSILRGEITLRIAPPPTSNGTVAVVTEAPPEGDPE